MRRFGRPLAVLLGVLMLVGLGSGTAAAGTRKLVEGTVYDATCTVAGDCGSPCPPPCGGPIPLPGGARSDLVCAQPQRRIVCPLTQSTHAGVSPDFCLQGLPCGVSYPIYTGEGVVTIRKRGFGGFLARRTIVEGHFRIGLTPGEYFVRPYLPDPLCWSGSAALLTVDPDLRGPVPAAVEVVDYCGAPTEGSPAG